MRNREWEVGETEKGMRVSLSRPENERRERCGRLVGVLKIYLQGVVVRLMK